MSQFLTERAKDCSVERIDCSARSVIEEVRPMIVLVQAAFFVEAVLNVSWLPRVVGTWNVRGFVWHVNSGI